METVLSSSRRRNRGERGRKIPEAHRTLLPDAVSGVKSKGVPSIADAGESVTTRGRSFSKMLLFCYAVRCVIPILKKGKHGVNTLSFSGVKMEEMELTETHVLKGKANQTTCCHIYHTGKPCNDSAE
ncbi:hypothetical protein ANANG_G00115470 [Anguilla anguilla]|uniref:Uncharacterized protein n=1 Tax=Anguilla anguilla TaxID=7936 RepID=A0A9D3MCJ5_ANGAN|nr:hypothetical protein ANANG_G00115470 [Anguilla anguilla]